MHFKFWQKSVPCGSCSNGLGYEWLSRRTESGYVGGSDCSYIGLMRAWKCRTWQSEWFVKFIVSAVLPAKQSGDTHPRRRFIHMFCVVMQHVVSMCNTRQDTWQLYPRRTVETARNAVCPAEILKCLLILALHMFYKPLGLNLLIANICAMWIRQPSTC